MTYDSLQSASQTLAAQIYACIKADKQLAAFFHSQSQISLQAPSDLLAKHEKPCISIYLYRLSEMTIMRNQPPSPNSHGASPLMYLNLHYLITPLTGNVENDQMVMGKILQLFAEKPVLCGVDLQGGLARGGDELRVVYEELETGVLCSLWGSFDMPYRFSVGYRVYPVHVDSSVTSVPEQGVVAAKSAVGTKAVRSTVSLKAPVKPM